MKPRQLAALLMMISGVTHVIQLQVYGAHFHGVGAVLFGIAYFVIGWRLLYPGRTVLWWGAILPSIGGVLGIVRFVAFHANPFTVFHVIVDAIVVPICLRLLQRRGKA
jgi:hypothetical protein